MISLMMTQLRRASILLLAVFTLALAAAPQSGFAQHAMDPATTPIPDTVPVQVALMYDKLLGIKPDFQAIMELNQNLKEDPTKFGNDVLRKQQMAILQKTYAEQSKDSVFLIKRRVTVKKVDDATQTVTIDGLTDTDPFLFPLTDDDQYGIFLHNSKDMLSFGPPFEYKYFYSFAGYEIKDKTFPLEILVRPVAADRQPFPLEDGTQVKPVIADIVQITILDPDGKQVALVKRFNGWQPQGAGASLLDLKDNPLHDALPLH